jgi:hypothetical protein
MTLAFKFNLCETLKTLVFCSGNLMLMFYFRHLSYVSISFFTEYFNLQLAARIT